MSANLHVYVEDALSLAVVERLIAATWPGWQGNVRPTITDGNGNLRNRFQKICDASRRLWCLVLTDLDQSDCPPGLVRQWISTTIPEKLIFRIAVREVEAWLLADSANLSNFLGVSRAQIPRDPEVVDDPKRTLVAIARRSRRRDVREGIPPAQMTSTRVGPEYNPMMTHFVRSSWDPAQAALAAPSLRRTIEVLQARQSAIVAE